MQNTPENTLENATIQWQENGAPYSTHFADIYFSRHGGLEETEHIFIAANALERRWAEQDRELALAANGTKQFTIAELGFGTGLNFLCTWRAWLNAAPQHLRLHYIACEKFPLQAQALAQALSAWPELAPLADRLLKAYPDHSHAYHRLHLRTADSPNSIILDLYYGDAEQQLQAQAKYAGNKVDAWFLDGFAPRLNPQMWSAGLMTQLARLSKVGSTTLSTYSVAGHVVRGLRGVGFDVTKVRGFGKKRHMLSGHFAPSQAQQAELDTPATSWLDLEACTPTAREVIVIGAGLAGCATAYSLARKGFKVLVLEQEREAASGASGNRQAVLQCRLSNGIGNGHHGSRQFNLQAFLYAAREFAQLQKTQPDIHWQDCGVLNLDCVANSAQKRGAGVDFSSYARAVAHRLSPSETQTEAGIGVEGGSNFIPLGGYLRPKQLCAAYLQHPNIRVHYHNKVTRITQQNKTWQVYTDEPSSPYASADALVIANSYSATQLSQTAPLPIVPIRGQVTYVHESAESAKLRRVVCAKSYMSPAWQGLHSVGASYSRQSDDLTINNAEHQQNISGVGEYLQDGILAMDAIAGGRVSIRATTADRMPIVGPVPDFAAFAEQYQELGQRQRQRPDKCAPYLAGLYISVGHGSHGLSNAPLAGEYLASLIAKETLPIQGAVVASIHPARFTMRALKRQQGC